MTETIYSIDDLEDAFMSAQRRVCTAAGWSRDNLGIVMRWAEEDDALAAPLVVDIDAGDWRVSTDGGPFVRIEDDFGMVEVHHVTDAPAEVARWFLDVALDAATCLEQCQDVRLAGQDPIVQRAERMRSVARYEAAGIAGIKVEVTERGWA